jgi:hypothetical protein
MSWKVVIRPEAEQDMVEAAAWYEALQPGLGAEFVQEVIQVWDALAKIPYSTHVVILRKISVGVTQKGFHIALSTKLSRRIKLSSWRRYCMPPVTIVFGSVE